MSSGTILSMRRPTRSKSQSLQRSKVRAKAAKKVKEKPPWDVSFLKSTEAKQVLPKKVFEFSFCDKEKKFCSKK